MRLLGVWCLVGTTGRFNSDRLSDITAAFGRGDTSCHRQHIDPSTNRIEAVHDERTGLAEIQYLPRTARWWIPQLAQGDVALRVAGVNVRAMRREAINGSLDDRTERMIDHEREVDELIVDRFVTAT